MYDDLNMNLYLKGENFTIIGAESIDRKFLDLELLQRGSKAPINQNWKIINAPLESVDPYIS